MAATVDTGKVGEYRFAAELLDRNWVPLWPSTEMFPYDVVADTGEQRHRVQVKASKKKASSVTFDLRMKAGKRRRKYTKRDTDFIALYVFEYDAWYILPVEDINSTEITVNPGIPGCKWTKYLGAWDLLK